MGERRRRLATASVAAVALAALALTACGTEPPSPPPPAAADAAAGVSGSTGSDRPTVVDNAGGALRPEHAEVVRSVHRALADGNMQALRGLYAGDDWAGQQALLMQEQVRADVLSVLRTHPANLGEGYVYPGFSVAGWAGQTDRADGRLLGVDPVEVPDPVAGFAGYQTAFFLDSQPPQQTSGALRWRGIARSGEALSG